MTKVFLFAIVFLALAVPAQASAPTNATLQREITALQAQNKLLRAQVATIEQRLQQEDDRIVCFYAVGQDDINNVWHTLNLLAQYLGFPPQADFPRYDDQGSCQRIGVTRTR